MNRPADVLLRIILNHIYTVLGNLPGYSMSGHPVDKVELIILGGTWDNYDWEYRKWFVKMLFYAANTFYDANKREPLSLYRRTKN